MGEIGDDIVDLGMLAELDSCEERPVLSSNRQTPIKQSPTPDRGFLCDCTNWTPGHTCPDADRPTNAPTSAREN